jgi:HD-GYP domain-containing protein (c-di-GMP phosphodiesterase class II)
MLSAAPRHPSSSPSDDVRLDAPSPGRRGAWIGRVLLSMPRGLTNEARACWWAVAIAAVVASGLTAGSAVDGRDWELFALMTTCAAITQLFAVYKPGNRVFHAALLFVVAATILLPSVLLVAMCVLQHLPDWIRQRYRWYIQSFNICNYVVSALAAAAGVKTLAAVLPQGQVGMALAGLAGAAIFLLANRLLLATMLRLARGVRPRASGLFGFEDLAVESVLAAMGVQLALFVVHVPWIVPLGLAPLVIIYYLQVQARELTEASNTIRSQNDSLAGVNQLLRERTVAAMEGLAATVDARDAYTAGHARRVQRLSLLVGSELGLEEGELEVLGYAALFHDIGKIAIPDSVLLKPGRLDEAEWATMQTHAEEGARIIACLGFLDDAVGPIRHHHERMDGTGYPDGLAGEDIPLAARIIHLADAVDSMLTHRVYSRPRTPDAALAEVRRASGEQFCPSCAAALERVVERHSTDVVVPRDAVPQTVRKPLSVARTPMTTGRDLTYSVCSR